eukprot:gnl/TRDRNA2_/TRDRNA2_154640_c1_seq1.p1 gnl/TRDRNA2_/TRDRNA2_154640_c1~~gnl/TRDRNA2_/TRDRNA2_154640_c1_seq1.p1  ORF type:complete len:150 (-),score=6.95 gnl/TRDRNA2_/TRDRNA2_154640_c1_seq1:109-558(-)
MRQTYKHPLLRRVQVTATSDMMDVASETSCAIRVSLTDDGNLLQTHVARWDTCCERNALLILAEAKLFCRAQTHISHFTVILEYWRVVAHGATYVVFAEAGQMQPIQLHVHKLPMHPVRYMRSLDGQGHLADVDSDLIWMTSLLVGGIL